MLEDNLINSTPFITGVSAGESEPAWSLTRVAHEPEFFTMHMGG